MAAPMQLGRQAQAAQGRAVKQTRANYAGAAGNELAPAAPAAVKPQAIAPVGPVPQPVARQQAPRFGTGGLRRTKQPTSRARRRPLA